MNTRNMYIVLAVAVLFAVFAAFFLLGGRRPVAIVNGRQITSGDLNQSTAVVGSYYSNLSRGLRSAGVTPRETLSEEDIKIGVLNGLIENILIEEYLYDSIGRDLANELVNEAIADAESGVDFSTSAGSDSESIGAFNSAGYDFKTAASSFYNDTYQNVLEAVLMPQARRDILYAQLLIENNNIDMFLGQMRRSADVKVLMPGLSWNEKIGQVVAN